MTAYELVRALHLGSMAVWMGAGLLAPRDVADSLARSEAAGPLMSRLRRAAQTMNAAAWSTVGTGVGLMALGRGWATPARIWWGLGVTLLAIGVGRVVIRPAVGAIAAAQRTGGLSPGEVQRLSRRFTTGVRLEDGLRLAVLLLMLR